MKIRKVNETLQFFVQKLTLLILNVGARDLVLRSSVLESHSHLVNWSKISLGKECEHTRVL